MRNVFCVVCALLCLGAAGCASSSSGSSGHGGTGTNLTISSINPSSGSVGTVVTITGTSFGAAQGSSSITFNGTPATPTAWGASSITVSVPAGATTGSVVVTVGTAVSNPVTFTVLPTPAITNLSPTAGPVSSSVTITGTNFGAQGTVTFNGVAAAATNWSATSITVTVPTGASTGNVVVTAGGVASSGVSFTVLATPSITSLSATSGPVGSTITIAGTNFGARQGTSTVTFNGTSGVPTAWSATSITVAVPSGATSGNVVVTVNSVPSNGVSFTVLPRPTITSLNPASAPVGGAVTITGTNFGATQGTSTVTFNGTAGAPSAWSATSITVPVPTGATTGNVVVTVGGVPSSGFSFTVLPTPNITALTPTSGPAGTPVTITGTNFGATQGTSTVKFGGTTGTPTSWSDTSITVPVPSGAATGNVVVTVSGVPSNGVTFTITVLSITSITPTAGVAGDTVTITGTNFGATQGTSSVTFHGTSANVTTWSDTSITVTAPIGVTTGNVVVSVGTQSSNGVTFTVSSGGPVSDDFHGMTLNSNWTFYAYCCGFQKMSGNDVLLVVPSVTSHDIYGINQGVGILQTITDVDFEVEAKFDSLVTQGDQVEGILVQQDAQNFIWFATYYDGSATHVYAANTQGGTASQPYNNAITIPSGSKSFWMRVKRSGANWTQSWSFDGTNYSSASFTQSLVVSAIGPAAGNDNDASNDPSPSFTGAVDYFMNTASPISPTDGGLPTPPNQPVFNIWYGDNQNFGKNGIPQQWVNILGNVSAPSGIASASYTLNGGATQFLRVGPNGTRLADTGDFNVEIDHASLMPGANTVVITATDNLNNTTTHTVTVNWLNTGQAWPLPYSINWSTATQISDVAQVVDGQWAIQSGGTVRTTQTGYDRTIALGDETWTDYEITAELTLNNADCYDFGTGLIVGWTGNTYAYGAPALSPDQPRSGHPFFGVGEYSTAGGPPSNAALDIYANSPNYIETTLIRDTSGFKLTPGVKYMIKFDVQRNPDNTSSHFSLKAWPAGTTEPANWTIQADGDASTGAVLLNSFRSDVSVGNISVVQLP